jgi:hypothetical protein
MVIVSSNYLMERKSFMFTKDCNGINWNEIFVEDSSSPTGLRWKISPADSIKAGDVAGSVLANKRNGRQCFKVTFNKTFWLLHRILWVMRNGEIDASLDIDHIDGNGLNNSVDNLRLVSSAVNQRNKKQRSDNSSGVTGVSFCTTKGYVYACAQYIDLNGKLQRKKFSCKKLGTELAFQQACEYRKKMITVLNAHGAGYSERHGELHDYIFQ